MEKPSTNERSLFKKCLLTYYWSKKIITIVTSFIDVLRTPKLPRLFIYLFFYSFDHSKNKVLNQKFKKKIIYFLNWYSWCEYILPSICETQTCIWFATGSFSIAGSRAKLFTEAEACVPRYGIFRQEGQEESRALRK